MRNLPKIFLRSENVVPDSQEAIYVINKCLYAALCIGLPLPIMVMHIGPILSTDLSKNMLPLIYMLRTIDRFALSVDCTAIVCTVRQLFIFVAIEWSHNSQWWRSLAVITDALQAEFFTSSWLLHVNSVALTTYSVALSINSAAVSVISTNPFAPPLTDRIDDSCVNEGLSNSVAQSTISTYLLIVCNTYLRHPNALNLRKLPPDY